MYDKVINFFLNNSIALDYMVAPLVGLHFVLLQTPASTLRLPFKLSDIIKS